jgi:CubicO group peptidase (beta-lactamase class C family)
MSTIETTHTGFMRGFPPSADKLIRFADGSYRQFPQLRWTLSNMQQLVPTKPIWRGSGAAYDLLSSEGGIESLEIMLENGEQLGFGQVMARSLTDGFGVLHRGRLVHQSYYGATGPHTLHVIQSCAKSFAGLMAEMMIEEGALDGNAVVPFYLPELANTAWQDATLRQVLDMLIDMEFDEDYLNPQSEVYDFLAAGGMIAQPADKPVIGVTDYLPRVKSAGPNGVSFAYREPNINVLTWIMIRVADEHLNDMLSRCIWQHIGAEHDAYYLVDPNGFCTTAGCTLRDYLRFGEAIRTGLNGRISDRVRASIFGGGDRDKFAAFGHPAMNSWSFRSQFWVRHIDGRICPTARGAYGQFLYIDPVNELVIVRFASTRFPPGYLDDHLILPLIDTITEHLAG